MSLLFINRGLQITPSNFRPISVAPIIAKILEKLVVNTQLLSPYQGAYRIGRFTEQILSFVIDAITQSLDAHQVVCTRKAFDSLTMLNCWID